jgi:hypothetical protein
MVGRRQEREWISAPEMPPLSFPQGVVKSAMETHGKIGGFALAPPRSISANDPHK